MPDLEIGPGEYRERKPKGWRWRLPLAHDDDARLPFVMFIAILAAIGFGATRAADDAQFWILLGGAALGFGAGCMFILWTRP